MIPGMGNPKQMMAMLKQMGIKTEEINAKRVEVICDDKKLVFMNPQIMKIGMPGGPASYQLIGEAKEEKLGEPKTAFSDDEIALVAEKAGVSKEKAAAALKATNGDIAEAIVKLQS